jgi:hypothetical protein
METENLNETKLENINKPAAGLPLRITTPEVCNIARIGKGKLRTLIRTGKFPKPIDRGGKGYVWNTHSVLQALGIYTTSKNDNPWERGLE